MKSTIANIIAENQELDVGQIVERENIVIPLNLGMVITLIGSRRSGKTYLFYQTIRQLKQNGVDSRRIVFLNFEDERLNLQQSDLDLVLQAYQELYPDIELNTVYFFFDEIQNVKGWEKFVRRMFDTRSKNLFITGSNSKLLSTEIATELRGRTLTFTVYPFSFREYLKTLEVPTDDSTLAKRSKLIHLSQKFLTQGGFPELLLFDAPNRIKALQQYFNVMIYRDVVERYHVSNPEVLKFFIKKIFASVTSPLSINKSYNDLKSLGYKVSNKYLYDYQDYCNTVFLIQTINKFNYSEIKQAKSDKKAYVIDHALLAAIDFKVSENRGKLFENMVALEFLKSGFELMYFKEKYECDFIVRKNNVMQAVQVTWSMQDDDTRQRELRGLAEACRYLNSTDATIVTFDEKATLIFDQINIEIVPFYKYFGILQH